MTWKDYFHAFWYILGINVNKIGQLWPFKQQLKTQKDRWSVSGSDRLILSDRWTWLEITILWIGPNPAYFKLEQSFFLAGKWAQFLTILYCLFGPQSRSVLFLASCDITTAPVQSQTATANEGHHPRGQTKKRAPEWLMCGFEGFNFNAENYCRPVARCLTERLRETRARS